MKQRHAGRSQSEREWHLAFTVLVVLAVILVMRSVATSEPQPPSGVLSDEYRDPNIRREYMFPEYHAQNLGRTPDRNGFSWDLPLTATLPPEYIVSGTPRLYQAGVFLSGELKSKAILGVVGGKIRTTDRFRIRYRHDFREQSQSFYSVVTANLTYFGEVIHRTVGEIQVYVSDQEDIPADFLTKLDQNLARRTFDNSGSVIITIMQPDSIGDMPLPPDPIPEPVETVTFTDLVQEAMMFKRGDPALRDAEMFTFGQQTQVSGQFWDDNKPTILTSVRLFRTKIPGLIRVSFLANRQGRLLDVSKPRGPYNPNSNPFLAENAFLTELKIVGPLHALTLTGRYKDDGKGRITIPPTDATLSFVDSLRLFDRVDVFLTFMIDVAQ